MSIENSVSVTSSIIDDIKNLQVDGLEHLYNLEPTQNNLFYVGGFYDPATYSADGTAANQYKYSKFRVQSTEINGYKVAYKEIPQIRTNVLDKVTQDKSVSISFIDDVYHSVNRYHADWAANWYDPKTDSIPTYGTGKYRNVSLTLYHYIDNNTTAVSPLDSQPVPKPIYTLFLYGLMPQDSGKYVFNMEDAGNSGKCSFAYKFQAAEVQYYSTYSTMGVAADGEFNSNNTNKVLF